jgi:hypothetical protein
MGGAGCKPEIAVMVSLEEKVKVGERNHVSTG